MRNRDSKRCNKMDMIRFLLGVLVLCLVLSACGTGWTKKPKARKVILKDSFLQKPEASGERDDALTPQKETTKPEAVYNPRTFEEMTPFAPSRRKMMAPSMGQLPFTDKDMVSVAVDEMPLPDFIHYVFSELLNVNYVLEGDLQKSTKPVSLNLHQTVTERRLFEIARDVLEKRKVAINYKDGVFYIWPDQGRNNYTLGIGATMADIPDSTDKIYQVIPIRYADVSGISRTVQELSSTVCQGRQNENVIVVLGTREEIEKAVYFTSLLDRPPMRGRFVGLLSLTYWEPGPFLNQLRPLLREEGIPVAGTPGRKGVYFAPIQRLGKILLFASENEWLERVRQWTKVLDVPDERTKDKKEYFLYYPENSNADELGQMLGKILGVSASGSPNPSPKDAAVGASRGTTGAKGFTVSAADVKVVVDENRNALIFHATAEKFEEIETLLKKLDVIPEQVTLEATVAEVTLTGSFELGVEWAMRNYTPEDTGQTGIFDLLAGGTGLSWSMISRGAKFEMLLNALATEKMVTILASPNLTVRDGKTASITVGQEVPILTQQATTSEVQSEGTSGIIQSVQYRSTGVSLSVTPTVHAKGIVTLLINQSVTQAEPTSTSKIDSPTILNRSLSTEVVLGDGQTVVLGGMISKNESEAESGVPFLKDIPLLGYLFKSTSRSSDRTELIVMITPRILRSSWQIDEMRNAIFDSLQLIGTDDLTRSKKPDQTNITRHPSPITPDP